MISATASGSKLAATSGSGKIKLGILTVGDLSGETGHIQTHTVRLLDGYIEFDPESKSDITTLAYEYKITVDTKDPRNVIVDAWKVTNGDSLDSMNVNEGNRALKFSFDSTTRTYQPNADLSEMSSGRFYVEGHNDFNGESNILAVSPTEKSVSLFKVTQQTEFELWNIALIKAEGDKGAALKITTHTASVIAKGVTFSSNTATGYGGGAIYVSQGASPALDETKFIGNSATVGNGGAISIDRATVTLSGALEVTGNSAAGKGGAII
ncbi:MAG: hypothetical protein LBS61_03280 [Endomicrobium sp.]|jgi:predicted outer membrane repeat protein|nr:hypothetical protein [Endomicrobium sp.]